MGEVLSELEIGIPHRLAVGRGSAFALGGWAFDAEARTRRLDLEVGGERRPADLFRLPRADVFERHGADSPGAAQAFRSGFVTVAAVPPVARAGALPVRVVLTLAGGREETVELGELAAEPRVPVPAEAEAARFPEAAGPRVAICMATYEPPPALLHRQLDSLRAQTHRNWVCAISDDGSSAEALAELRRQVEGDPRFVLSPGGERRGFYGNFERALAMAPEGADYVALCDQDDLWRPEKIERLLEAIGGANLVYSDARLVDTRGGVISPSYWTTRRNNHTNFASLLLANSVTGAASLFRRQLLDDVLPFPPALADPFHDHWIAVVAMALGEIAYVSEPLYDYTQHGGAVIGHDVANRKPRAVRRHLMERLRNPGDGSRVAYYYGWQQQLVSARVLRARCWERMGRRRRAALVRVMSADDRVTGVPWLLARRARRLWGRNETLDRELFYAYALGRRRAMSLLNAGRDRPGRLLPRDAAIPSDGGRG